MKNENISKNIEKCAILSEKRCKGLENWQKSGVAWGKTCGAWKMLQNEYLVANIGFDTAQNEPLKVRRWFMHFYSIRSLKRIHERAELSLSMHIAFAKTLSVETYSTVWQWLLSKRLIFVAAVESNRSDIRWVWRAILDGNFWWTIDDTLRWSMATSFCQSQVLMYFKAADMHSGSCT